MVLTFPVTIPSADGFGRMSNICEQVTYNEGGDIYHCLFSTVLGAFGEVVALDLFFLDISFVSVYT